MSRLKSHRKKPAEQFIASRLYTSFRMFHSLRSRSLRFFLFATLLPAVPACAQLPFIPFGARSMALGGATLGLSEPGGLLDNPAQVESIPLGIAASLGGEAIESGDFLKPLRLISGNDPALLSTAGASASAADVRAALRTLSDPGNGLLGEGRAGLALIYKHWGLGVAEYAWAGVAARPDLVHVAAGSDPATSFRNNTSSATFRGLTLQDVSLARGASFLGGRIYLGAAAHLLKGTTFSKEESLFTTEVGDAVQFSRRSLTGVEEIRYRYSVDAGAMVSLGVFRAGAVVKAVNRPSFPLEVSASALSGGEREVTYGRQARVGASVHIPIIGIVAAADLDVTSNDTLVDGLKSRELGGGLEWTLGVIALRGGLSINLESPNQTRRFSGGIGVGFGPVKADAAVIYRPDRSALGAILSARIKL